ncbi:membrane protein [Staphylococcus phage PG-2021_46]
MNKETLESFNQLGEKLEKVGSHGYEKLIKYTVIEGITSLIIIMALLITVIVLWVIVYKSYKKCNKENNTLLFEYSYNRIEGTGIGSFILFSTIILSGVTFFLVTIGIPFNIQKIINPEGYLIKDIIDNLK